MRLTAFITDASELRAILRRGWFVGVTFTEKRFLWLWVRFTLSGPPEGLRSVSGEIKAWRTFDPAL